MTWLALAWRFRKPLGFAIAVVAVIALGAAALAWHAGQVRAFGAERYAAGESSERIKWQSEMARLAEEHARQRTADEMKLRDIGIQLNDTRMALREQRDGFDADIQKLEQEDQAAGALANPFDPRVLRIVR